MIYVLDCDSDSDLNWDSDMNPSDMNYSYIVPSWHSDRLNSDSDLKK